MRRCVSIVLAAVLISLPAVADPLVLGRFSAGDIGGWQVREFEGETRYRIVELDGRKVLEADSDSSASSLYLEREIDLSETPVLEWSWRVEKPPGVTDERTKDGDDFAARVYVVAPGEGIFGLPLGISYVWAGQARVGEFWPNPFTSRVMMFALDSGNGAAGTWRSHRRDVRADFLRLFGRKVDRLEGVAIMTDSDNSRRRARAWYGDLALRRE